MNIKLNKEVVLALGWDPITDDIAERYDPDDGNTYINQDTNYVENYNNLEELLRYITAYSSKYKFERFGKDCWGASIISKDAKLFTAPTFLEAVCKLVVAASKGDLYV